MLPTVADVLRLPVVQRGDPVVVAGGTGLDRPVRWVHVSELSDIANLLSGGELLLMTGIALPEKAADLRRYVAGLVEVGVSGVAVELGRRYAERLPAALVTAAEASGLPLVALRRVTSFVAVTQAVHEIVVDAHLHELLASEEAHRAFTELTLGGAGPQRVVDLVAAMAGRPVVYESLAHRVVAHATAGRDAEAVIGDWERRARAARLGAGGGPGWLSVDVGARGGTWGRLVMLAGDDATPRHTMLLERGATALVMGQLMARDEAGLEQQSHRTLLTELATASAPVEGLEVRAAALGVPLARRHLTGLVVRPSARQAGELAAVVRSVAGDASTELRDLPAQGLVGPLDDDHVAVLLATRDASGAERVVAALADRLHAAARRSGGYALTIGVGATVDDPAQAGVSMREALLVVDSTDRPTEQQPFLRLYDLRLRGLLHLLRDDARLHNYVERELGPLLAHDAARGRDLTATVGEYCRAGGNKALTASRCRISRASLYDRLRRAEEVLGVDLGDAETILALHVALLARQAIAASPARTAGAGWVGSSRSGP